MKCNIFRVDQNVTVIIQTIKNKRDLNKRMMMRDAESRISSVKLYNHLFTVCKNRKVCWKFLILIFNWNHFKGVETDFRSR